MKIILASVALMLAGEASAQTLFKEVKVGTTLEELAVMFPSDKFRGRETWVYNALTLPNCAVNAVFLHPKQSVERVRLEGTCPDAMFAAAVTKWGPPLSDTASVGRDYAGRTQKQSWKWVKDGVSVTMNADTNNAMFKRFTVMIEPAGGGL